MFTSFQPDGLWFVFNEDGKTLVKDLQSKGQATFWISKRMAKAKALNPHLAQKRLED